MNQIVIVCGPTCSGKSRYAVEIAKRFDGEIVSCDSMQIYRHMDVGSAKPTSEEMDGIPHHMIGVIDPKCRYSAASFKRDAEKAIDDIISRGKLPVLAGGTGLYINSIIYDMDFAAAPDDPGLREELDKLDNDELYSRLSQVDPEAASRIHPNNRKKVLRAAEAAISGIRVKDFSESLKKNGKYDPVMLCLTMDRSLLYDRINRRVDRMFEAGLVDEVRALTDMGLGYEDISMKGIGYKEVIEYLEGKTDLETAVENVKKNTRHYAKRQFTWLKQYEDMEYFDITGGDRTEEIITWLKSRSGSTTKATNPTT